jgi:hypothetical protein
MLQKSNKSNNAATVVGVLLQCSSSAHNSPAVVAAQAAALAVAHTVAMDHFTACTPANERLMHSPVL